MNDKIVKAVIKPGLFQLWNGKVRIKALSNIVDAGLLTLFGGFANISNRK